MENGDYIIVDVEGKKKLCKITNVKANKAVVADKSSSHSSTSQFVEYDNSTLLAWLGSNPQSGSVYGVKVEPYYKKLPLDPYERVLFFRKTNKEERHYLLKDLQYCAKKAKAKGFGWIFPLEVEVRNPRGKTYGMASYYTDDSGTEHSLMQLFPHDFSESMKETIFHEFGHFIWNARVGENFKALWLELYSSAYDVFKADKKILATVKKDFKDSGPRITEEYTEEYEEVAEKVLDFIEEYHGLNYKNLCTLYDNGFDIIQYFPTRVQLLKHTTLVTEYADKNVEEFFAETFKLYMTKEHIIPKVESLLKSTLKSV